MAESTELSVIIAVTETHDLVEEIFRAYQQGISAIGCRYEFIYVLDGNFPDVRRQLRALQAQGEPIRIIVFARSFGEATALSAGFRASHGDLVMTLPEYPQVSPRELTRLVGALGDNDLIAVVRRRRHPRTLATIQARLFNKLMQIGTDLELHDLGCRVRLMHRRVAEALDLHGDQQRFLPIDAARQGFRVAELVMDEYEQQRAWRPYRLRTYFASLLDMLSMIFMVRFLTRPLRLFGAVGASLFAVGSLFAAIIVIQRLFFGVPLSDRPALIFSSLFIVLGIQILVVGLIGELIIFTRAKSLKKYAVEQVVNGSTAADEVAPPTLDGLNPDLSRLGSD